MDTTFKELSGEKEKKLVAELGGCDFVGMAETAEYVLTVGVTAFCLDGGSLAFNGCK